MVDAGVRNGGGGNRAGQKDQQQCQGKRASARPPLTAQEGQERVKASAKAGCAGPAATPSMGAANAVYRGAAEAVSTRGHPLRSHVSAPEWTAAEARQDGTRNAWLRGCPSRHAGHPRDTQ